MGAPRKVLILGCGNVLLGDDGFGPAVALRCRRFKLGRHIEALDVGTGLGSFLLEVSYSRRPPKALIIVDLADAGAKPGEIFRLRPSELASRSSDTFGLHDFPSVAVFDDLKKSRGVEVEILACQPSQGLDVVRMTLSKEVEDAVGPASRLAVAMAREALSSGGPDRHSKTAP